MSAANYNPCHKTRHEMALEHNADSQPGCSEFGRPVLTGFFRTLTVELPLENGKREIRGYHKPILIAGGMGTVRPQFALKDSTIVPSGSIIVVLGGPSMLVGLGGGSASSATSAEGSADLVRFLLTPTSRPRSCSRSTNLFGERLLPAHLS